MGTREQLRRHDPRQSATEYVSELSMHEYRISGLTVASELELPGAIPACANNERPDVTIRRAKVRATLGGATTSGPTWEMAGEEFLLRIPRLARFLIARGQDIAVQLEPDAKERDAAGVRTGDRFRNPLAPAWRARSPWGGRG